MSWFAQAPANIALIKYMGKKDNQSNLPENPSLSYTLSNLLSSVTIECHPGTQDYWEPLPQPGNLTFNLSLQGQQRFLSHLSHLKIYFNYSGSFIVRSTNNFPQGTGLASSASSFAALTKCAVLALSELCHKPLLSNEEQACLSRFGSGSSCRSFFAPWALWENEQVQAITLPYQALIHQVIIISHAEKEVSSSEAHLRVKTTPHYNSRPQRATNNLKRLINALEIKDWQQAYEICWQEFQDMHSLFSQCSPSFSYMNTQSTTVLNHLQALWRQEKDGPLITMDAGPNIHLLYRSDQAELAQQFKNTYLVGKYDVL